MSREWNQEEWVEWPHNTHTHTGSMVACTFGKVLESNYAKLESDPLKDFGVKRIIYVVQSEKCFQEFL